MVDQNSPFRLQPRAVIGLVILLILVVVAASARSLMPRAEVSLGGEVPFAGPETLEAAHTTVAAEMLVVHVTGAVARPGVFELPQGARVDDAIALAGGFAPDAAEASLNRAGLLQDGQQITVLREGEHASQAANAEPGPLNLNTATAAELEELPGIGPALAGAIVKYRDQHGAFSAVADLDEVSGIGPALMERLAGLVAAVPGG